MSDHRQQLKKLYFFNKIWERSHCSKCAPHRSLLVLLLLLLFLAACTTAGSRDRRGANVAEPTPIATAIVPTKPTYTVARGDVVYAANFNGRITPTNEISLAFAMNGEVAELFVERGETVLEGIAIARLDSGELERELVLAHAALAVAQSRLAAVETTNTTQRARAELNLALAQLDLDFARQQAGDFPSATQSYEIARRTLLRDLAQIAVDELSLVVDPQLDADVQQAQLRVDELEAAIANATLIAPADGVLSSLNLSPGRSVLAQEPVGALTDMEELEISANLQPSQMEQLVEGMPVQITVANRPGETLAGFIRQLPYPYGTRGSADVRPGDNSARISFDNPEIARQFQPGDRMNLVVVIEEHSGVLWLPPAAVRDFNGRHFVVVEDEQGQSRVDVQLGIEGNGRVEIVAGLSEGQIIVGQ